MIFENCAEYIYGKFEQVYPSEKLHDKNIILFGYEAVTKTLAHYLDNKGFNRYTIVDMEKYGQYWVEKPVLKPSEVMPALDRDSVIFIINQYEQSVEELKKYPNITEQSIVNFSGIRMSNMPNSLIMPENARKISLQECQAELFELLDDFHNFCEENGINYFMGSGTLLGAVRHKGFIPWDDDLDIFMPVKDFFKFCKLYKGSEKWEFDSIFNENMTSLSVSTLNKIKSKITLVEYHTFPIRAFDGIGLDIFPICGYPSDKKEQIAFERECRRLEDLWKDKAVIPYGTKEYSSALHKRIFDEMNELLLKYDYDASEFVGLGYFGPDIFPGDDTRVMRREWFENTIKLEFESKYYNAPAGYDGLLKRLFNDYMALPPEEKRIPHNVNGSVGINRIEKVERKSGI